MRCHQSKDRTITDSEQRDDKTEDDHQIAMRNTSAQSESHLGRYEVQNFEDTVDGYRCFILRKKKTKYNSL